MNAQPINPWLRLAAGLLLLAVAAASFWIWKGADMEGAGPVCLLSGFEPFGGSKTNASWEMLKPLAGQTVAGYRIVTVQLPVVYDELAKPLEYAIAKHRPELVICFGEGGPLVEVELLAVNGYAPAQPLDNHGRPPSRQVILAGGKTVLRTQLPVSEILQALKEARIGAKVSRDPGGFLCNECFYRLMARPVWRSAGSPLDPASRPKIKRGFVHVPPAGTSDPAGGTYTLEKLQQAVRIIIEQTAHANP